MRQINEALLGEISQICGKNIYLAACVSDAAAESR